MPRKRRPNPKHDRAPGKRPGPYHKPDHPQPQPVTITRPDGTVEEQPPYTPQQLHRIQARDRR